MRSIIASIFALMLFLHSIAATTEANEQRSLNPHQNKNTDLVMIVEGKFVDSEEDNKRSNLSQQVFSFQTIEEKKVADHNQKRLEHYKPRLANYNPPKEGLSILVTGYSSTPDQTWGDPFTTASGTRVHKGTMACPPQYPFGTKVKIESMGTFICEDRGGMIKGNHFDMWFESRSKAMTWGKRIVSANIAK